MRNFLLDRAYPSEERLGVRSGCTTTCADERNLSLVLTRRKTACPAGEGAVRCDIDAGFDRSHDAGLKETWYRNRPRPSAPERYTRVRIVRDPVQWASTGSPRLSSIPSGVPFGAADWSGWRWRIRGPNTRDYASIMPANHV